MRIATLLLSSAAALAATTVARAADVIMVEPEPVNFVRVCDVYGSGFFYIPGTETCMRVGGYVRMQINVAGDPAVNAEGDDYEVDSAVRARLNFDVREETELGLLRAYARLQATNASGGNASYQMDQGYVQLGGLLLGYRDSLWANDVGGIEDGLLTDTDLTLGDINTNQISYTFALGGFSAVIGLEDDGTGDVVPDVHGKLVYSGAWGGAFLSAVYDETFNTEDAEDFFFSPFLDGDDILGAVGLPGLRPLIEDGSNDAFALKAGLQLNDVLTEGSALSIEGSYAFDPTVYSTIGGLGNAFSLSADDASVSNPTPGEATLFIEWALGAGYRQSVGDFTVAVAGQYGELFDATYVTGFDPATGAFSSATTSGSYYSLVGNVGYDFTSNFGALAEVQYTDVDFDDLGSVDQTRGFLRFVRSF